jgi:ferredoxin-NADP reductase
MLSRHLATLQGPIYYIAGPPAMVTAMRQTLVGARVEEDDIRTEEFAGYWIPGDGNLPRLTLHGGVGVDLVSLASREQL